MKSLRGLLLVFMLLSVSVPVVGSLGVLFPVTSEPHEAMHVIVSEEPGTRLDPDEHTPHVPIFINGTADFVSQGWPGAGTEMSPYRIRGLNITTVADVVNIRIINTDAYFLIEDCFVRQVFSSHAVSFVNASHGLIEYATIEAADLAVSFYNASNARISRSVITSTSDYCLQVQYSNDFLMQHSVLNSKYRLIGFYQNVGAQLINNTLHGHPDWNGIYMQYCNYTLLSNLVLYDTFRPVYAYYCPHTDVLDLVTDADGGLFFAYCNDVAIRDSTIISHMEQAVYLFFSNDSVVQHCVPRSDTGAAISALHCTDVELSGNTVPSDSYGGIFADSCPRLLVSQNTVRCNSTQGISLSTCENSTVIYNSVFDGDSTGIYLVSSPRAEVSHNTVANVNDDGIFLESCFLSVVSFNTLTEFASEAIYATNSGNLTISSNTIEGADSDAVHIDGCDNSSISDNVVTGDGGFYVESCDSVRISNNLLTEVSDYAINTELSADALVEFNTITDCLNGIRLHQCDSCDIRNNDVSSAQTGVYVGGCTGATLFHNTVDDCVEGILLKMSPNASLEGNAVTDCGYGIEVDECTGMVLLSNSMTSCGFWWVEGYAIEYYNHTLSGNTVNSKPVYYGLSQTGGDVDGNSYGQVILVDCNGTRVSGGTFTAAGPFMIYFSVLINASHVTTASSHYCGVVAYLSQNLTLSDVHLDGEHVPDNCGILLLGSPYFHISNSEILRYNSGLRLISSGYGTVSQTTFSQNHFSVVEVTPGHNVSVLFCEFYHAVDTHIVANANGDYWNVTGCVFHNATAAITWYGNRPYFSSNTFTHCGYGVYVTGSASDNGMITRSQFESCDTAIYILSGDYWTITNNTIMWSNSYGVWLSGSTGTVVYYNTIALSASDNGYDSGTKYWDDGMSQGNVWDDYTPPPPYIVSGSGASQDRYPSQFVVTLPIINHPLDRSYAEFSEGHSIGWRAFDDYLKDWWVTIDGLPWANGIWTFDPAHYITVNVDGLPYGMHTATITVRDINLNTVSDTVIIHVYDDTPPTIDGPPDTEAFETGTGQTLMFEVYDQNPQNYVATLDGNSFASGTWSSPLLSMNIDSIPLGVHEVLLTIYDVDGNSAFDAVQVLVLSDTTPPTIDNPNNMTIIFGTVGNFVVWTPADAHPSFFEVRTGSMVVESGSWGGGKVLLALDDIPVGNHNFTLTVWDKAGNSASDNVLVTVLPPGYQPPPPFDLGLLLIVAGITAGVVVVVAVVYKLKKK
ncbi:MAG: right-handed parallel beta-helix repeat-containing protein [Candidatus Thorarchaeota archaeon]|nr:right-handed parallel beta-helix repeat-containing protein [Candidatus Thorarchaeota archaeon]